MIRKFLIHWVVLMSVILMTTIQMNANRYVYIQGDKQVPFVVAVEGYSLPKLGQNFCIIPNLEPGIVNLSVTFQTSQIPVHKFKIRVPEHSSRGFILTRVSESSYALFDLQTNAYIPNNNKEDEAFLAFNPEDFKSTHKLQSTSSQNPIVVTKDKSTPERNTELPKLGKPLQTKRKEEPSSPFLDGIDLNSTKPYKNNKNNKSEKNNTSKNTTSDAYDNNSQLTTISAANGCSTASSIEDFEDFSAAYVNKADDTEKLKYIRKNKSKICLSTSQIHILSNFLQGQSSKYELFEMLRNDVVDKENYKQLQKVFNNDYMKEKFLQLIQ